MTGWRPALRIAVRVARRNLGRTILVAVLVGLPVFGATLALVLGRTATLTAEEARPRNFGTADARVSVTPFPVIEVNEYGFSSTDGKVKTRRVSDVRLDRVLPAGSTLTPARESGGESVELRTSPSGKPVRATVDAVDLESPLTTGMYELHEGRFPGPGELALTVPLAERLGVKAGATTLIGGSEAHVAGLVVNPECLGCTNVVRAPTNYGGAEYLVGFPPGTDFSSTQRALAKQGIYVQNPVDPLDHDGDEQSDIIALVILVGGLGLMEVILLAGAAFAVGARRQTRELGLVGAGGGTVRQIRLLMLAQSLVLGVIAATAGAALGVAAVFAGTPLWEKYLNSRLGPFEASPVELAVVWMVGVGATVAAGYLPARAAARLPIVAALSGRLSRVRSFRRANWRSALLLAAGVGTAVYGAWLWRAHGIAIEQAYATANGQSIPSGQYGDSRLGPALMLLGILLAMVGIVTALPALLSYLGRFAGHLPLTARLAVRDAGRQRHRVAPATAAVIAAVSGAVVVSWGLAAADEDAQRAYSAQLLPGQMAITSATTPAEITRAVAAVRPHLPEFRPVPMRTVNSLSSKANASANRFEGDGSRPIVVRTPSGLDRVAVAVGDEAVLPSLVESPTDTAREALGQGKAVVFEPGLILDGKLALQRCCDKKGNTVGKPINILAVLVQREHQVSLPAALLPTDLVTQRGWLTTAGPVVLQSDRLPTDDERDAAASALAAPEFNTDGFLLVEDGYQTESGPVLLAAIAGAGLVSLCGIVIAVALSAAEGRADLATLAAVGARPAQRRLLAVWSAGVIALLGGVGGIFAGSIIGALIVAGDVNQPLAVPWRALAYIVVCTPLLGMAAAAAITPARLPSLRHRTS